MFTILTYLENLGIPSRVVGGAVRHFLQSKPIDDIDIAVNARIGDVMAIFDTHNIKHLPTGLRFGSITAFILGHKVEITELRLEHYHGTRHPDVQNTSSWYHDAKRRDFTMNALYMDNDKKIYDFWGGLDDLHSKTVRFIGDLRERVKEDPLRILRFFRFLACVDPLVEKKVHREHIESLKDYVDLLKTLSRERVATELMKFCLNAPNITDVVRYMKNLCIDDALGLSFYDVAYPSNDGWVRLFLLLRGGQKLPFPREITRFLSTMEKAMTKDPYDVFFHESDEFFKKFEEVTQTHYGFIRKFFPITANELMEKGIVGKDLGTALKIATQKWIEVSGNVSKGELLDEALRSIDQYIR